SKWKMESSTVLEIRANQTSVALGLLADRFIQMRNEIFQQHVFFCYLLVEEGGVCRTSDGSYCYLQMDGNGKVVKQIIKEVRKLAHVLTQMWKVWELDVSLWLPGGHGLSMHFAFFFAQPLFLFLFDV
uniref:Uncharacterized protein n=1 Tax=Coturnix japonica TaxID=93934 RepID=A0A8C2T719_COTJA